jgi:hypothetical protein
MPANPEYTGLFLHTLPKPDKWNITNNKNIYVSNFNGLSLHQL